MLTRMKRVFECLQNMRRMVSRFVGVCLQVIQKKS